MITIVKSIRYKRYKGPVVSRIGQKGRVPCVLQVQQKMIEWSKLKEFRNSFFQTIKQML